MQAVILIGHGSLRSASGASMIRIAARLRERGVAPLVEASFLNYSRPTLAEMVEKCHAQGATTVIVQPYFLIEGAYVQQDLPALLQDVARAYPDLDFHVAQVLGDHPAMVALARRRVQEAEADAPRRRPAGLLFLAHGTPLPAANRPIYSVMQQVQVQMGFTYGQVGFLDCNEPEIPQAVQQLVEDGARYILALPYFLHMGRHVREDLPGILAEVRQRYPGVTIHLARHLDYDLLLADVIAHRVAAVQEQLAAMPCRPAGVGREDACGAGRAQVVMAHRPAPSPKAQLAGSLEAVETADAHLERIGG